MIFVAIFMMVGTVEIMEPFGEVHTGVVPVVVIVPGSFPGLVGLVFPCHKAPVVTADLLQIEQREQGEYIVAKATTQPFGVENGTTFLFQPLDDLDMLVIIAVKMIGNDVRMI